MTDFLKAFQGAVTMEDYMWKYSVPMTRIMSMDNTHVNYLSEKQAKNRGLKNIDLNKSVEELNNDLGMKIDF